MQSVSEGISGEVFYDLSSLHFVGLADLRVGNSGTEEVLDIFESWLWSTLRAAKASFLSIMRTVSNWPTTK